MITREEIRSIPELYKSIERDKEQLRYLQEKATSVPGMSDRERVQTSPGNGQMRFVEDAIDLNKDIQKKELELAELQIRAGEFIKTVENELTRRVLVCRYLRCYSWSKTETALGYDIRYLQRLEYAATDILAVPGRKGRVL